MIEDEARPALLSWRQRALEEALLRPRARYGYFRCQADGAHVLLTAEDGRELARFVFPRRERWPHRCLADAFFDRSKGPDLVAAFVVTVGEGASQHLARLFDGHRYRDLLHVHGLAAETTERAADLVQEHIAEELALPLATGRTRFSFGYPDCPDLEAQRPLLALLGAERIGVRRSDAAQLIPEQSISALVLRRPLPDWSTEPPIGPGHAK